MKTQSTVCLSLLILQPDHVEFICRISREIGTGRANITADGETWVWWASGASREGAHWIETTVRQDVGRKTNRYQWNESGQLRTTATGPWSSSTKDWIARIGPTRKTTTRCDTSSDQSTTIEHDGQSWTLNWVRWMLLLAHLSRKMYKPMLKQRSMPWLAMLSD